MRDDYYRTFDRFMASLPSEPASVGADAYFNRIEPRFDALRADVRSAAPSESGSDAQKVGRGRAGVGPRAVHDARDRGRAGDRGARAGLHARHPHRDARYAN